MAVIKPPDVVPDQACSVHYLTSYCCVSSWRSGCYILSYNWAKTCSDLSLGYHIFLSLVGICLKCSSCFCQHCRGMDLCLWCCHLIHGGNRGWHTGAQENVSGLIWNSRGWLWATLRDVFACITRIHFLTLLLFLERGSEKLIYQEHRIDQAHFCPDICILKPPACLGCTVCGQETSWLIVHSKLPLHSKRMASKYRLYIKRKASKYRLKLGKRKYVIKVRLCSSCYLHLPTVPVFQNLCIVR